MRGNPGGWTWRGWHSHARGFFQSAIARVALVVITMLATVVAVVSPASASTVGTLSVAASTHAAGATHVDYTVGFTTSVSGALADGVGTITFTGPVGTAFPSMGCVRLDAPTTNAFWCMDSGQGTRSATGTWSSSTTRVVH